MPQSGAAGWGLRAAGPRGRLALAFPGVVYGNDPGAGSATTIPDAHHPIIDGPAGIVTFVAPEIILGSDFSALGTFTAESAVP